MPIKLPRIEGTAYDGALNRLIDSVNADVSSNQPQLAAHAVAAIVKFLMENHEVEAGIPWTERAAPLIRHIRIIPPMVDKLYESLSAIAMRPRALGCAGAVFVSLVPPVAAGLAWKRFVAPPLTGALLVGISVMLVTPSVIQCMSAWTSKGGRFFRLLFWHVRTQVASRQVLLPVVCTAALLLVPFSLADKAAVVAVACIWASTMLQWITPPTILLLGVSGSKSNELLPVLFPALFPAKIVHLLCEDYQSPTKVVDLKLHTLFTTSRTSGGAAWEGVVMTYLHLCERILVDLRTHSANLQVELSMIGSCSQEDKGKVLYLVDEDAAALPYAFDGGCETRLCLTVNDAVRRLRSGH